MMLNRQIRSYLGAACILLAATILHGEDQMNLWPDHSPEPKGVDQQHIPTLQLYHGPKAATNKPAVLLCPAGGYKHHSAGTQDIQWLNSLGLAVYVVSQDLDAPSGGPALAGRRETMAQPV